MTVERDQLRREVSRLSTQLDRIRLAAGRIEQIYKRANRRTLANVHSHEARAIAENCRIISGELDEPPQPARRTDPLWTGR